MTPNRIFVAHPFDISKTIEMQLGELDTSIDVEELLTIHYHNVVGEMLTMPVLVNKVGILRAQMRHTYAEKKLELDVYLAAQRERIRKDLVAKQEKATTFYKSLDIQLDNDAGVRTLKKNLINAERDMEIMDSFYWAVKSKDDKVNRLGSNLSPDSLSKGLVEERINMMQLKIHSKL